MSVEEYLRGAPQRDAEAAKAHKKADEEEDAYYDALGALVEQHPIGRFVCTRGHVVDLEK